MDDNLHVDHVEVLRRVRARLATVYHDLNNPLAVASGNVQYMAELLRMGDHDGLDEALEDIRTAIALIETRLGDVLELRQTLDERLADGGEDGG